MRIFPSLVAVFWLCASAAGPAFADGGGGDDRSNTRTCGSGEVWDSRSQKCVKAENGVLPDKALAENAFALAKAERYAEALAVLDLLQDPNTAVALNYRGYATRKLGRVEEGIGYYLNRWPSTRNMRKSANIWAKPMSRRATSPPREGNWR